MSQVRIVTYSTPAHSHHLGMFSFPSIPLTLNLPFFLQIIPCNLFHFLLLAPSSPFKTSLQRKTFLFPATKAKTPKVLSSGPVTSLPPPSSDLAVGNQPHTSPYGLAYLMFGSKVTL
jgi:hypothetical protein